MERELETKQTSGQEGCSTCNTKCPMTKLIEQFPSNIKNRIDALVKAVIDFNDLCGKKACNGKLNVDAGIVSSIESVKGKIGELQGMTDVYPELENAIVYVLRSHGNSLIQDTFLN